MGGNHQLDYYCYHVLLLLLLLHKACMAYRLQCPNRAVAADFFVDELEGSAPHFLDHNLFFLSGLHKKTSNFIGFWWLLHARNETLKHSCLLNFIHWSTRMKPCFFPHTTCVTYQMSQNFHGDSEIPLGSCIFVFFSRKKSGSRIWSSMFFGQTLCKWRVYRWVGRLLQRRSEAGIQAHDPSGKMVGWGCRMHRIKSVGV